MEERIESKDSAQDVTVAEGGDVSTGRRARGGGCPCGVVGGEERRRRGRVGVVDRICGQSGRRERDPAVSHQPSLSVDRCVPKYPLLADWTTCRLTERCTVYVQMGRPRTVLSNTGEHTMQMILNTEIAIFPCAAMQPTA